MNTVLHKAETRGHANYGWLNTYYTFSFGEYFDKERIHFGALRVLNDDTVAAGRGFGMHPHDNMEIITIPTFGELEHQDSMGNRMVVGPGDIQVMSAGTGIYHSEKNKNPDKEVRLFQIWVFPDKENVTPRYDQKHYAPLLKRNQFLTVVSPIGADDGQSVQIHQQAWFSIGKFDKDVATEYTLKRKGNGVYVFVMEGDISVNDMTLNRRDGLGVSDAESISVRALTDSEILLMEVPMY
ncbi:MAG: pirin family protein [Chitinophagaceae bacterium]|nr:pirin family protein [Chitinophagaceae bacterium]